MTGTRDPQQDGSIQAMLSDSGLETAAELRGALHQLRALVPDEAPAPRADLAALLAAGAATAASQPGPVSAGSVPDTSVPATTTALPTVEPAMCSADESTYSADESLPAGVTSLAERRGRKRRLAIVGCAVVGAMTLGAGAVAASSEDFRHSVSQTVGVMFRPADHAKPAPAQLEPSPSSVPAFPAPAATSPAGTPGNSPSGAAATGAASDGGKEPAKQTGHTPPATPPAVGRNGILPTPGPRPEAPGLPAAPALPGEGGNGNGGDDGKDLPRGPGQIVPTMPGVVPSMAPGNP